MPTTPSPRRGRQAVRRLLAAATIAVAIGSLASCGDDDEPSDTTTETTTPSSSSSPGTTTPSDGTTGTTSGIANPASEFCIHMGGTVDIVDEAGGQVGYCVLPDGTRVEEWEYFTTASTTVAP